MDTAEGFLAAWRIDPADGAQVMIILDEIASNIIKAAWPQGGEHHFTVDMQLDGAVEPVLTLLTIDDGMPFDPTQVAPPDLGLGLDQRELGGLGVLMVAKMSDSMTYSHMGGCNRLQITKRLRRLPLPLG